MPDIETSVLPLSLMAKLTIFSGNCSGAFSVGTSEDFSVDMSGDFSQC